MPFFSLPSTDPPPPNGLASQPTQEPQPVCIWSSHAPKCGPSPLPFPRAAHTLTATATAAGEFFLFGGFIDRVYLDGLNGRNDVYVFSTRDLSTTPLQTSGDAPTPRGGHGTALISTTLLIWGGLTDFDDQCVLNHDTLYLLNLVSREWTRVVVHGPGPGSRVCPTTIVVGSKLFVFGGRIGEKIINDMWTLDLNSLKSQPLWESYEPTLGNEKPLPRFGHVSVTTENRIIIFGGMGDQLPCNDTWSFDISTRKWTELQCTGSIPRPRTGHAAVVVDDVMYVFGGCTTDKTILNDLNALQLSTQRWFKCHNAGTSPRGRMAHVMVSDGTRVFVLGGNSKDARSDELSVIHAFDTKDIKYPEPECNSVNPNEKTTQLAQKSSTGAPAQEQPQPPKTSSSEAQGTSRLQNTTPAVSDRPASLQITRKRNPSPNGGPLEITDVNNRPRQVPEDYISEGSTEYYAQFAAPHSSSKGEVATFELEPQLSASLAVQTERDQRIAQLTDELALKSSLLEQAEANAAKAADRLIMQTSLVERKDIELVDVQAKLDQLVASRDQQVGQYEKELTNMRAKLGAKESELEAVRLRLMDAEKGWTKSKAEADTLRAQTATGSVNRNEDQVTRRLLERVRAIEAEMVSKLWNEKSIEEMECRNED